MANHEAKVRQARTSVQNLRTALNTAAADIDSSPGLLSELKKALHKAQAKYAELTGKVNP